MYPNDRVLVGVVNRKKDFRIACAEHWYRIPQKRMPRGIHAEYIAFFLSGRAFREQAGGVACFARITGLELVTRRELLPDEDKRAQDIYYKVQFRQLIAKDPPILNTSKRTVSFIRTTWDRFVSADAISDLYRTADGYVNRRADARPQSRMENRFEYAAGRLFDDRSACSLQFAFG